MNNKVTLLIHLNGTNQGDKFKLIWESLESVIGPYITHP